MDWIALLMFLGGLCLFFGGTALILISRRAPWASRLRWVSISLAPFAFMVLILGIFTPPGSVGEEPDAGLVGAFVTFLFGIAVITANWMTYRTYRARLSTDASKSV